MRVHQLPHFSLLASLVHNNFLIFPRWVAGSTNVFARHFGVAFRHLDISVVQDLRSLVKTAAVHHAT
jgi:hypothetical protein